MLSPKFAKGGLYRSGAGSFLKAAQLWNAMTRWLLLDGEQDIQAQLLNNHRRDRAAMLDYKKVYHEIAPKDVIAKSAIDVVRAKVGAAGTITLEELKEGAFEAVVKMAQAKLLPGVTGFLNEQVDMFLLLNGERPVETSADAVEGANQWLDAFDEHMLAALGTDMQRAIGQDFIGVSMTDCDLDDPARRIEAAPVMALRLAEAALPMDLGDPSNPKPSINKTLSAAGIVDADLLPYVTGANPHTPSLAGERVIDVAEARGMVEKIVGDYALRVGADAFDPLALDEILTSAFDDDQFISIGGVERLGGPATYTHYFLAYAKAMPLECRGNTLAAALTALTSGAAIVPPAAPKVPAVKITGAAKPSRKKKGATDPSPAAPGAAPPPPPPASPTQAASNGDAAPTTDDYADIVSIWRTVACDNDAKIAEVLGKSRGTVSNIGTGKSKLPLSLDQRKAVAKVLMTKRDELNRAVNLLA